MTLLASSIIDQARGRSAAFDPTRHPNKVVLQYLSAKVRELHGKVAKIDPDVMRVDVRATLPLADHDAGIDLGTTRYVSEVVAFDATGQEYPVTLIPSSHRLDVTTAVASAWQIGNRLYLTGPASLWSRMVSIAASIIGTPTTFTALTDTIPLPDTAELALVEACAAFMARRHPVDPKAPAVNVNALREDADRAEQEFLADVANRLTGQVIQTRDIYRP